MSTVVDVLVEAEASEREVEQLQQLFDGAGVPAAIRPSLIRRSAGPLPWAMIITVELAVLGGAFLRGLGEEAGRDAWRGLRSFVMRVFETRRRPDRPDGSIRVEERERTVILSDDLPHEAFRQAVEGELPANGYFVWNNKEGRWEQF